MKNLLAKWTKNYWSPSEPSTYVIHHEGRKLGLGACAASDIAAFNLTWGLVCGVLETKQDHLIACRHFTVYGQILSQEVNNYPLREWVCMMQPLEFSNWLEGKDVKPEIRFYLKPPTLLALRMQETANDLR